MVLLHPHAEPQVEAGCAVCLVPPPQVTVGKKSFCSDMFWPRCPLTPTPCQMHVASSVEQPPPMLIQVYFYTYMTLKKWRKTYCINTNILSPLIQSWIITFGGLDPQTCLLMNLSFGSRWEEDQRSVNVVVMVSLFLCFLPSLFSVFSPDDSLV